MEGRKRTDGTALARLVTGTVRLMKFSVPPLRIPGQASMPDNLTGTFTCGEGGGGRRTRR